MLYISHVYVGMSTLRGPYFKTSVWFRFRDSIINRTAFTGTAGRDRYAWHCHSPSIGSIVMATPTKVPSQRTAAWRVMNISYFFHY